MEQSPKQLSVSIGGYTGPSFAIELEGPYIQYTAYDSGFSDPRTEVIEVTDEQWQAFRTTLDSIDVWTWRSEYEVPEIVDGTSWSVLIAWEDALIDSSGSNGFPGNPTDDGEPTPEFNRFLNAVSSLLGGREFC